MPANQISAKNASLDQLINLHAKMQDGDHLRGGIKSLYSKGGNKSTVSSTNFLKHPQMFHRASKFGDAKAHVRTIIGNYLGSMDKADEIMKSVVGDKPRRDGFLQGSRPNKQALTKADLGKILKETILRGSEQERHNIIRAMGYSVGNTGQQNQANNPGVHNDTDRAFFMRNPKVSALVYEHCAMEFSTENPQFLDACHTYEAKFEAFADAAREAGFTVNDDGSVRNADGEAVADFSAHPDVQSKLNDVREEAHSVRSTYVEAGVSSEVNINFAKRQAVTNADIDNLSTTGLKSLFDESKTEIASLMQRDTLPRLRALLLAKPEMDASGGASLQDLKRMKGGMKADDHLRLSSGRLYAKSNHPGMKNKWFNFNHAKAHFWGGNRQAKFTGARRMVRNTLANHLGNEALADKAMSVWAGGKQGVRTHALTSLIKVADAKTGLDTDIRTAKANGTFDQLKSATTEQLLGGQNADAEKAFANYCDMNSSYVWSDAKGLTDFTQKFREAHAMADGPQKKEMLSDLQGKVKGQLLKYDYGLKAGDKAMLKSFLKGNLNPNQVETLCQSIDNGVKTRMDKMVSDFQFHVDGDIPAELLSPNASRSEVRSEINKMTKEVLPRVPLELRAQVSHNLKLANQLTGIGGSLRSAIKAVNKAKVDAQKAVRFQRDMGRVIESDTKLIEKLPLAKQQFLNRWLNPARTLNEAGMPVSAKAHIKVLHETAPPLLQENAMIENYIDGLENAITMYTSNLLDTTKDTDAAAVNKTRETIKQAREAFDQGNDSLGVQLLQQAKSELISYVSQAIAISDIQESMEDNPVGMGKLEEINNEVDSILYGSDSEIVEFDSDGFNDNLEVVIRQQHEEEVEEAEVFDEMVMDRQFQSPIALPSGSTLDTIDGGGEMSPNPGFSAKSGEIGEDGSALPTGMSGTSTVVDPTGPEGVLPSGITKQED